MPTRFHLIRHAAYQLLDAGLGGRCPYPLSAEGREQAVRLAERMSRQPIAAVISSPVARAMETASPIAGRLGLTVETDPAFAEIDFAAWAGMRFDDLAGDAAWQAWNDFRSTAPVPGGESMLAVQSRAMAGLRRLADAFPGAEVAIVSHADVIKAVLAHILGSPLDLMRRMEIGPASVSEMLLASDDARVVRINLAP